MPGCLRLGGARDAGVRPHKVRVEDARSYRHAGATEGLSPLGYPVADAWRIKGMLKKPEVEQIQSLLAQGYSYAYIHEELGFDPKTIGEIARGERPDYEALRREREEEEAGPVPTGPKVWCHGCGHAIYPPCQYCRTLEAMKTSPKRRVLHDDDSEGPPRYELHPKHQAIFEQIRAEKLCLGDEDFGAEP